MNYPLKHTQKILVTGSAGFIGLHTSKRLLEEGHTIIGLDSLNGYYDPLLKEKRNEILKGYENYTFYHVDISNFEELLTIVEKEKPSLIIHLAAQAGVRYSLQNPWEYEKSNTLGTINIFEVARKCGIKRVVFASSSSVYGANTKIPFSESDVTDSPISLYAATKKSCELIAHTYHHLYGIEIAGLRFFTVYGTYYRPDMALFIFAKKILKGEEINLFNHGKMRRDFTFIDDVVSGVIASAFKKELSFEIYNLGGDSPQELEHVVALLEKNLGQEARKKYMDIQPGDVETTYADITKAGKDLGFKPETSIEEGVKIFTEWFLENKDWLLMLR